MGRKGREGLKDVDLGGAIPAHGVQRLARQPGGGVPVAEVVLDVGRRPGQGLPLPVRVSCRHPCTRWVAQGAQGLPLAAAAAGAPIAIAPDGWRGAGGGAAPPALETAAHEDAAGVPCRCRSQRPFTLVSRFLRGGVSGPMLQL